jgi:hypothetical protein
MAYNITNTSDVLNDTYYNETAKPQLHLDFDLDSVIGPYLEDAYYTLNYSEPVEYFEYLKQNATKKNVTGDGENLN